MSQFPAPNRFALLYVVGKPPVSATSKFPKSEGSKLITRDCEAYSCFSSVTRFSQAGQPEIPLIHAGNSGRFHTEVEFRAVKPHPVHDDGQFPGDRYHIFRAGDRSKNTVRKR